MHSFQIALFTLLPTQANFPVSLLFLETYNGYLLTLLSVKNGHSSLQIPPVGIHSILIHISSQTEVVTTPIIFKIRKTTSQ